MVDILLTLPGFKSVPCSLCRHTATPAAGIGMCAFVLLCGCVAPARRWQPETPPDDLDDLPYVHYLSRVPVVTVDEGMRAVLMLRGSTRQWPTFEQRQEELRRLGAVKDAWGLEHDQILNKGTLAYMLRTVCALPKSLSEVLAAPTGLGDRRYALRTCVDQGVLPYGRAADPVSGGELLTALTGAERFCLGRGSKSP